MPTSVKIKKSLEKGFFSFRPYTVILLYVKTALRKIENPVIVTGHKITLSHRIVYRMTHKSLLLLSAFSVLALTACGASMNKELDENARYWQRKGWDNVVDKAIAAYKKAIGLDSTAGRLLGSVPADVARKAKVDILIVHTVD